MDSALLDLTALSRARQALRDIERLRDQALYALAETAALMDRIAELDSTLIGKPSLPNRSEDQAQGRHKA
jgi:hypothetical protein